MTFLRDCVATALEVFAHAWVVPCGDTEFGGEENYLLIAGDGDYAFAGRRALRHRLPRHRSLRLAHSGPALCVVSPAKDALLHAFDVEHAFGKAFAHELFGNKLVVAVK